MFRSLEKKIKSILLLFIASFLIISFIVIYFIIKNNIFQNIIDFSLQNISQRDQNVELYMNYMEETTSLVVMNRQLLHELSTDARSTVIESKLDFWKTTSLDILGITIYDNYGRIYTTGNEESPASIDTVYALAGIEQDASSSFWIYRKSQVNKLSTVPELTKYGVFSYVSKILDDDGIFLGYILVDTKLQTIFNYYVADAGVLFRNTDTYLLTQDNAVIAAPYNSQDYELSPEHMEKLYTGDTYLLVDNKERILTISHLKDSGDSILVSTPTSFKSQLVLLNASFIGIATLLIIIAFLGVNLISDSIITPLTILHNKMNQEHTGLS